MGKKKKKKKKKKKTRIKRLWWKLLRWTSRSRGKGRSGRENYKSPGATKPQLHRESTANRKKQKMVCPWRPRITRVQRRRRQRVHQHQHRIIYPRPPRKM